MKIHGCTWWKSEENACRINAFRVVAVVFSLSGWKQNGVVSLRKRRLLGYEITSWTGGDDQHQQRTSTAEDKQHNRTGTAITIQNCHS